MGTKRQSALTEILQDFTWALYAVVPVAVAWVVMWLIAHMP